MHTVKKINSDWCVVYHDPIRDEWVTLSLFGKLEDALAFANWMNGGSGHSMPHSGFNREVH